MSIIPLYLQPRYNRTIFISIMTLSFKIQSGGRMRHNITAADRQAPFGPVETSVCRTRSLATEFQTLTPSTKSHYLLRLQNYYRLINVLNFQVFRIRRCGTIQSQKPPAEHRVAKENLERFASVYYERHDRTDRSLGRFT